MSTLVEERDAVAEYRAAAKAKRDGRPWLKYRMRPGVGRHEQRDRDGLVRSYPMNSLVESQDDLAERWPEKFEIVRDQAPLTPEQVQVPAGYKLVKVGEEGLPQVMNGAGTPAKPIAAPKPPQSLHTKESLAALDLPSLILVAQDEEIAIKGFEKDRQRIIAAILGK